MGSILLISDINTRPNAAGSFFFLHEMCHASPLPFVFLEAATAPIPGMSASKKAPQQQSTAIQSTKRRIAVFRSGFPRESTHITPSSSSSYRCTSRGSKGSALILTAFFLYVLRNKCQHVIVVVYSHELHYAMWNVHKHRRPRPDLMHFRRLQMSDANNQQSRSQTC